MEPVIRGAQSRCNRFRSLNVPTWDHSLSGVWYALSCTVSLSLAAVLCWVVQNMVICARMTVKFSWRLCYSVRVCDSVYFILYLAGLFSTVAEKYIRTLHFVVRAS